MNNNRLVLRLIDYFSRLEYPIQKEFLELYQNSTPQYDLYQNVTHTIKTRILFFWK